ncbi:sodium:proton antiporter, partial [Clavibacter michiganensis subsp. insidiosus]
APTPDDPAHDGRDGEADAGRLPPGFG